MRTNQSAPSLNRGLSSNFCWLRSANHVKFTEECVMFMEEHVLIKQKMFTNGLAATNLNKKNGAKIN